MVTIVDKIPFYVYCENCSSKLQFEEEDKHYVSFGEKDTLKTYYITCPVCGQRIYRV